MQLQPVSTGELLTAIASATRGHTARAKTADGALTPRARSAIPTETVLHGELLRGARPTPESPAERRAARTDQGTHAEARTRAPGPPPAGAARGIALYLVHAGLASQPSPRIDLKA